MSVPQPPSARERIGGRWAISLRGYAVFCALLVVGTALADVTALGSGVEPGRVPLFVIAQWLLVGAALLVAHVTVFRRRRISPVPVWAVMLLGAVLALARPAAAIAIHAAQGHALVDAPLVRTTVISVVLAAILLPALAYAFATRAWYTGARARLIARDVQIQAERLRASGAIESARDGLRHAVSAELDSSRARAAAIRAKGTTDAEQMADLLMRTAHESVRPLSHGLWPAPGQEYPSMSWRQVLACEARRHPLPILVPSVGFVVISAPLVAAISGWTGACVLAFVAAASIGGVFRAGRSLIGAHTSLAVPVVVGAVLIAPIPLVAVGAGWFGISAVGFIPAVVLLALLLVAAGMPAAASEAARSTIADLQAMVVEREVEQWALEQEHARMRRELAAHLHGTLQPRLVNASHAVREAARDGDAALIEAAMRDAETALSSAGNPGPSTPGSLAQVIATARHDWARVLDLAWDVQATELPASGASAVAEVVRESLANAVVHGRATAATVRVVTHDDDLVVTVIDNGIGPQGGGGGLGTDVLDAATSMRWTLQAHGAGGSALTAVIRADDPA